MKIIRILLAGLLLTQAFAAGAAAQEKAKAVEDARPAALLKIQVVFSEFDGEKKVSSRPYTLSTDDRDQAGEQRNNVSLRMGIKVPILTQGKDSPQVQYMDVGTAIDCRVKRLEEGRYWLNFSIRRSSVYVPEGIVNSRESFLSAGEASGRPVLRDLSGQFFLILRDGETKQSSVATDPLTGRQVKVDVTLTIVK